MVNTADSTETSVTVTTKPDGALTTVSVDADGEETSEETPAPKKTPTTDTTTDPTGEPTTDSTDDAEPKPNGMKGPIIGIVAVGIIAGGYCAYKKRQDSEGQEGGNREDKKLFKKVFKGKTQKKATKEEMVPTFAVQSEEQV